MELSVTNRPFDPTFSSQSYSSNSSNPPTISSDSGLFAWVIVGGLAGSGFSALPNSDHALDKSDRATLTQIEVSNLASTSSAGKFEYGLSGSSDIDSEIIAFAQDIAENQIVVSDKIEVMLSKGMIDFYD